MFPRCVSIIPRSQHRGPAQYSFPICMDSACLHYRCMRAGWVQGWVARRLHADRWGADGNADAFTNSGKPNWPVAESSRSHASCGQASCRRCMLCHKAVYAHAHAHAHAQDMHMHMHQWQTLRAHSCKERDLTSHSNFRARTIKKIVTKCDRFDLSKKKFRLRRGRSPQGWDRDFTLSYGFAPPFGIRSR